MGLAASERALAVIDGGRPTAAPTRGLLFAHGLFALTPLLLLAASWAAYPSNVEAVILAACIALLPLGFGSGVLAYLLTLGAAGNLVDLAAGRGDALPRR